MKTLKVTWKGTKTLIMHSCQCVNPLNPIQKELKKYTSKRTKTDEDLQRISDLEWEAGAYWKEGMGLYIPGENVIATIVNGAKLFKKGTDVQKYVSVPDVHIPFNYGENLTKEELIADKDYRDVRPMVVGKSKVIRTRPRFDQWNITFDLEYEEDKIDLDTILLALENAGKYVGLCDSRKYGYGRFVVKAEELD